MAKTRQPPVNQVSKGAIKCRMIMFDPDDELWLLFTAGAPTSGSSGDGASWAGPGSLCVGVSVAKLYINTGTKASPTWTVVGSQS